MQEQRERGIMSVAGEGEKDNEKEERGRRMMSAGKGDEDNVQEDNECRRRGEGG